MITLFWVRTEYLVSMTQERSLDWTLLKTMLHETIRNEDF